MDQALGLGDRPASSTCNQPASGGVALASGKSTSAVVRRGTTRDLGGDPRECHIGFTAQPDHPILKFEEVSPRHAIDGGDGGKKPPGNRGIGPVI
jgi:hypothetical protein